VTNRENALLNNALDSLDRLFDRHSSVLDVWALLFATAEAIQETPHYSEFVEPVAMLRSIISSNDPAEQQRASALDATDRLRHYLADILPLT